LTATNKPDQRTLPPATPIGGQRGPALWANASAHRPAKRRVLVVDDERAICELLSLYLPQKGLEVATVQRAVEARTLIEQGQFDLLLLDWRLEGADGLDLLQLSKARHPSIPVIIFTGGDLGEVSLEEGLAREADALVRKASPLAALSEAIFRHLDPPA
jgi:CheY-like chemotaxis protein